jgi:hypothetical protein
MEDLIYKVANRAAASQFEDRYARMFNAMSLDQAKSTLGFSPRYNPTPDEIVKAYRSKAIENHPDRGGDPEKMVAINVAKDILDGKARPSSGAGAGRANPYNRPPSGGWAEEDKVRKPEPPKVVETIPGTPFSVPGMLLPPAEIKFISKTAYGSAKPNPDATYTYSYDMWAIYAQSRTHHIFVGLRHRPENFYFDRDKGGRVNIAESWEFVQEAYPISKDIMKIAVTAIKKVMTGWNDNLKPMRQLKYVAWPGGRLTEAALAKIKSGGFSGGAPLKDVLIGQSLAGDAAAEGRKTNVEMYYKGNKEKRQKYNERLRAGEHLDQWLSYDWFVRVNGTEYLLTDKTIDNLTKKHFMSYVLKANELGEGIPKNLTKMKGSPWRHSLALKAHEALDLLVDALSGEPTGLVLGLMKALEDWEEHDDAKKSKKAAMRQLVASTSIHDAAHLCGVEPYEVLRAWE